MINTNVIKDYIQAYHIIPLENLMGNDISNVTSPQINYDRKNIQISEEYKNLLHEMMLPYYRMYLSGDHHICIPNMESVRWQMKRIIDEDDMFGQWASEQDLILSAEGWGDNMKRIPEDKRIYQFFHILEILLHKGCYQDWQELSTRLKKMLFKAEVYSDYKTDEVLCVLHAFTMIMQQDWSQKKKEENLELLRLNWLFLKYYYSVMTRHIVGVKWTNFYDVTKTVLKASQSFKPHMHIYYCGLMDCVDELHFDLKHKKKMDLLCMKMQEVVNSSEPSEILYELCDTFFPEEFQRMLREHRPKSYKEIEDENSQKDNLIQQLRDQSNRTCKELERSKEILEKMVLSSIPIEDIDAELEVYRKLGVNIIQIYLKNIANSYLNLLINKSN